MRREFKTNEIVIYEVGHESERMKHAEQQYSMIINFRLAKHLIQNFFTFLLLFVRSNIKQHCRQSWLD